MSLARIALAACGMTLALATTAGAQALAPDLQDRMAFFLNPTGQVTTMRLNDTGHGMAADVAARVRCHDSVAPDAVSRLSACVTGSGFSASRSSRSAGARI